MAVPEARRGRDGRAEERKCAGTSAGTIRVVLKLVSSKYPGCSRQCKCVVYLCLVIFLVHLFIQKAFLV